MSIHKIFNSFALNKDRCVTIHDPKISRMTMLNLVPLVVNCKLVLFVKRNMSKTQLYR